MFFDTHIARSKNQHGSLTIQHFVFPSFLLSHAKGSGRDGWVKVPEGSVCMKQYLIQTAEVKGHGYYTINALPMSVLNFTDHLTI